AHRDRYALGTAALAFDQGMAGQALARYAVGVTRGMPSARNKATITDTCTRRAISSKTSSPA
ncbi:hypothetical protein, partial [Xylophilus ampelinus]|uniref:hypothetical protein n=1 Tax=Xylophilus ampelinus TaxID=54067 RepID=UPI002D7942B6